MKKPSSMNSLLQTACSIIVICSCLLQAAHAESALLAKVRAGDDVKVVLLGTSLTANGSWPASLQSWLATESPGPGTVTVVNRAASGQASDHGLAVQTPLALTDNPDAVFFEFSMNDAATSKNITLQQAEDNLNGMLDAFVAQNPNVILVLQTMNSLPPNTSPFSPRVNLNGYYQIYRDVAVERSAILIDHYPNWLDLYTNDLPTWNSYMTDAVHPNALGQNTVLMPELKEVLGPPSEPPPPPTGDFLVAWDDWQNLSGSATAPDDIGVSDFSANVISSRNISGDFGSTDGTYGSAVAGANSTNIRALLPNSSNPSTTVSITNSTGEAYSIDSLHFDVVQRDGSAREVTVTYVSGGLGPAGTQIFNETYPTITASTTTVLREYDLTLSTALTDTVLETGETATFEVALADFEGGNSTFLDNLAFRGTVPGSPTNTPPNWLSNPVNETGATEDSAYSSSLTDDADDTDGDPLTFAKVGGPAWLSVAANGALSGTPGNGDVGANSFTVSVSDSIAAPVNATLNITVANVNDSPEFVTDPFSTPDATIDSAYTGTIAGSATDPDGDLLTYSKVDGPTWLSMAADGTLSGIPTSANEGANSFTVSASDGGAPPVEATLNINVTSTPPPPTNVLLAAWDVWSDASTPYSPDTVASGFSASVTTATNRINGGFGSTDGDFGTLVGAATQLGGVLVREDGGNLTVTIQITNNTGESYSIDSLHFDFGVRIVSPDSFTLTYASGGLGNPGTQIDSQSGLAVLIGASQGAGEGDYADFDYDLAGTLGDTVLDDGESATFTLVFSGQSSATASSVVDNIAFQGAPVGAAVAPHLSGFIYDLVTGNCVVSIKGAASTTYKLVEADHLDFSNPDQNPVPLTTATVGTLDGNTVVTTPSGEATVEFNLGTAKSATFVRAEEVP